MVGKMTYDVKCDKCGFESEIEHSIVEDHPECNQKDEESNECGGELITQFNSPPPVRFIGDGWTPKFRTPSQQRSYSKGRMTERKQSLKEGGSIHSMDENRD